MELFNDRAVLRAYATYRGVKNVTGFIRFESKHEGYFESDSYTQDYMVVCDGKGEEHRIGFDYKDLFHFIVRNYKFHKK